MAEKTILNNGGRGRGRGEQEIRRQGRWVQPPSRIGGADSAPFLFLSHSQYGREEDKVTEQTLGPCVNSAQVVASSCITSEALRRRLTMC